MTSMDIPSERNNNEGTLWVISDLNNTVMKENLCETQHSREPVNKQNEEDLKKGTIHNHNLCREPT